jgi:tight adherence protein B
MPDIMSLDVMTLAVFLAALAIGLVLILARGGGGGAQMKRRLARVRAPQSGAALASAAQPEVNVRKGGAAGGADGKGEGLERLARRVLPRTDALSSRLERAGLNMPIWVYAGLCLAFGLVVALALFQLVGLTPVLALIAGAMFGFGLPHMVVGWRAKRRVAKFLLLLPEAVDLMVRTVKSGLPVAEAISLAGRDMAAPAGGEVRGVADNMRMGRSLEEALGESARRLDIPEFDFLVISLSLQRETGGNIAETLSNLSSMLRRRQTMKLKVKALSSEARASAWIVGLLPFAMLALLLVVNPTYIASLFDDPRGLVLIAAGLVSQFIGVMVMRTMSRFEI